MLHDRSCVAWQVYDDSCGNTDVLLHYRVWLSSCYRRWQMLTKPYQLGISSGRPWNLLQVFLFCGERSQNAKLECRWVTTNCGSMPYTDTLIASPKWHHFVYTCWVWNKDLDLDPCDDVSGKVNGHARCETILYLWATCNGWEVSLAGPCFYKPATATQQSNDIDVQ